VIEGELKNTLAEHRRNTDGIPTEYAGIPCVHKGGPRRHTDGIPREYAGIPTEYAGIPREYAGSPVHRFNIDNDNDDDDDDDDDDETDDDDDNDDDNDDDETDETDDDDTAATLSAPKSQFGAMPPNVATTPHDSLEHQHYSTNKPDPIDATTAPTMTNN
jgi:hypothetical protein